MSEIKLGLRKTLSLGNLDSLRDWGHAKDYVYMQWKMLQEKKPQDFVIATGKQASVREFVNLVAINLDMGEIIWEGNGVNEIGRRSDTNEIIIRVDKKYFRPAEVNQLIGDAGKAFNQLKWKFRFISRKFN